MERVDTVFALMERVDTQVCPYRTHLQTRTRSLADAKVAEDAVNDVLGDGLARDEAERIERAAHVNGDEIARKPLSGRAFRFQQAALRRFQRLTMPDAGDQNRVAALLSLPACQSGQRRLQRLQ